MERLAGLGDEVGSTNGTGGVGSQPGVNAIRVKHMIALWDQTQRLVVLKLVQAHGALQRAFPDLEPLDRGVHQGGEHLYYLRVQPALDVAASGEYASPNAAAWLGFRTVADVDGEESHEEKGGDQNDDDDCHGRAELRVLVGVLVAAGLGRDTRNLRREESEQQQRNGSMLRDVGEAS